MTKSEKIQELSELWGKCLCDYHKNCDTQHFIYIKYCFGNLTYEVEHGGYIANSYIQEFFTLDAAQNYLINKLVEQIIEECDNQLSKHFNPEDWDKSDLIQTPKYWRNILENVNKLQGLITDDLEQKINEEDYWSAKKDLERMNYHYKLVEEILDKEQIPVKDTEYDMEYSINYRVELLIKKLKSDNTANFLTESFGEAKREALRKI